jgi:hypothetical protein
MSEIQLNHIAILTSSVERAADHCRKLNFDIGPTEIWDGEGTKEIYIGSKEFMNRMLLIEAVQPGAYQKTIDKRGPGLHHIAIDVLDVEGFMSGLSGSGWFLHSNSLKTFKKTQTVWLARPGMEVLIEVQQCDTLSSQPHFITKIEMPLTLKGRALIEAIGLSEFVVPSSGGTKLLIGDKLIPIEKLLGSSHLTVFSLR